MCYARTTQQTSDAETTLVQSWSTVYDTGPTLHQNRFNISRPPGTHIFKYREQIPRQNSGPRPKAASPLGHRLWDAGPTIITTSVRRIPLAMQASAIENPDPMSAESWPIVSEDDPTPRRHRPRASPANTKMPFNA